METELQEYVNKMRNIQNSLLKFIDYEANVEENYQNLIQLLNDQKVQENIYALKSLLYLMANILNNHNRSPNFFGKFEKLINQFSSKIKQSFSNFELFQIFKKNNRILLFLIENDFLHFDSSIITYLSKSNNLIYFVDYFSKELQSFKHLIPFFYVDGEIDEEKRRIGENDSDICNLIRKDLIEEFIIYVNKNDTNLQKTIDLSIYETNSFLMMNDVTLIEYAAFFGSSQVFKYLYKNGVPLTPSLWNFAIHGNNPELILILQEEKVVAEYRVFEFTLKEAIKCHHNGIANFICENLIDDKDFVNYSDRFGYFDNLSFYCFHYYNYDYFPYKFTSKFTFYYACQFDYYQIVEILLKTTNIDINSTIVLNAKINIVLIWFFIHIILLLKF